MPKLPALGQLDNRFLVVLGAFLTQFMIIGLLFSYALFFKAFEVEYGWSRTLLSASMSFAFVITGVFAFFAGHLNDRFGPRLVLSVTGILSGIGYMLLSEVTQAWQLFVVFGLFIGMGLATHDVVTLSTIVRQFRKRRGIMTGVVKVGTASGQMIVPLVTAAMIAAFDWRLSLLILGAGSIVFLLVAAFLMGNGHATETATAQTAEGGVSVVEARRSPTLWKICAIQFSFFTILTTIPFHIVVHGMDLGMSTTTAATLLTVLGAASIIGRLTVGGLVDRIGGRRGLMLCFVPLIASLLFFYAVPVPGLVFGGVAVYGMAHGGFFTVTSPTVAEYFGLKSHGAIFGMVLFFGAIGGAVGPVWAGWIFDATDSYGWAFVSLAGLASLGLLLALRLPAFTASNRDHG